MSQLKNRMICQVYKSSRREGMYLFVERQSSQIEELKTLPSELLSLFGTPVKSMMLMLHTEKKLGAVSAKKVIDTIYQQGFYLQMPPKADEEMSEIAILNSKLQLL